MRREIAAILVAGAAATASGCHSVAPPKPIEQLTTHEAEGRRVFGEHCSSCHYDRVDQPLHGPSLRGLYKKQYLPSGAPANDDRVTATILHGRNQMPAQGNLDPQELDDLLAYLHTL